MFSKVTVCYWTYLFLLSAQIFTKLILEGDAQGPSLCVRVHILEGVALLLKGTND